MVTALSPDAFAHGWRIRGTRIFGEFDWPARAIVYSVSPLIREIGMRMARGAPRSGVQGMILRQAGEPATRGDYVRTGRSSGRLIDARIVLPTITLRSSAVLREERCDWEAGHFSVRSCLPSLAHDLRVKPPMCRYSRELVARVHACRAIAWSTISAIIWV
jgi:hypothetical protein